MKWCDLLVDIGVFRKEYYYNGDAYTYVPNIDADVPNDIMEYVEPILQKVRESKRIKEGD